MAAVDHSVGADESDERLVHAARSGERAALERLVRRYQRAAYVVALAVLGTPDAAEDAAQDAFIKAIARLDTCEKPERFAAWFLTIVRNHARNAVMARAVRRAEPLDEAGRFERSRLPDPAAESERRALGVQLCEALDTLNERQREVVLLHDLDGFRHEDIAAALGISTVLSRQILFQARRALRLRLEPPGAAGDDHGP